MASDDTAPDGSAPDDIAPNGVDRRGFLSWGLATAGGVLSLFAFVASALRMPLPSLLPEKTRRVNIGRGKDFPPGTAKYLEDHQIYVFADPDGIFAMTAICTHLGCAVRHETEGFICPCHGSRYDLAGEVLKGPAARNLDWYEVRELPGGRLAVDPTKVVPAGTRIRV